jgi:hypothetical protein
MHCVEISSVYDLLPGANNHHSAQRNTVCNLNNEERIRCFNEIIRNFQLVEGGMYGKESMKILMFLPHTATIILAIT